MVAKSVWVVVSFLVASLAIVSMSLAEHQYEITVTIGDTTLNSSDGATYIPIAGTYTHAATGGSITIANVGSGGATAQVAISDTAVDEIKLINAKITANNTYVTAFPITFKRRMTSGPDTAPPVYYKMYAKGLFQQAAGSSIYIGWFGKNPLSSGFFFLDSKQYTPGLTSFTIAPAGKSWPTPPDLTSDRVPKVEFTVKLTNATWLDFDSTQAQPRMIKLYTSGSPDQTVCTAGDPDCIVQDDPTLYLPYQYEAREVVGRKAWWCRWFRIACGD